MKRFKYFFFVVILIAVVACADDSERPIETEPFVGSWTIIEVAKDNALQPAWANVDLIISQENETGGTYQMVNTPYDSIWSVNGRWNASENQFALILNDTQETRYTLQNDILTFTHHLPWTRIPCDANQTECLTVETGQWNFKLRKSE